MARSKKSPHQKQFLHLRNRFGSGDQSRIKAGELVWELSLQPSPLCRIYRIQIRYSSGGLPSIFVLDPDLSRLAAGRQIPHLYS